MLGVVWSLEVELVHRLEVLGKLELNVFWLQDELAVLLGLPGDVVLLIRREHLGTVFLVFILEVDASALSAGAGAAKAFSLVQIGKVVVLAAQEGLQVDPKKVLGVRLCYHSGVNWLPKGVFLIEPHLLLSETVVFLKIGVFQLEAVHPIDYLNCLV